MQLWCTTLSLGPNPSDSVEVSFYVEEPGNCNRIIQDLNTGRTKFNLGEIAPRQSKDVQINWVFPNDIGAIPRIYAVIDPDNKITSEIHERNNTGFFHAGSKLLPGTTVDNEVDFIHKEFPLIT